MWCDIRISLFNITILITMLFTNINFRSRAMQIQKLDQNCQTYQLSFILIGFAVRWPEELKLVGDKNDWAFFQTCGNIDYGNTVAYNRHDLDPSSEINKKGRSCNVSLFMVTQCFGYILSFKCLWNGGSVEWAFIPRLLAYHLCHWASHWWACFLRNCFPCFIAALISAQSESLNLIPFLHTARIGPCLLESVPRFKDSAILLYVSYIDFEIGTKSNKK